MRIFLLSPAHCGGQRARLILRGESVHELALKLRSAGGAPVAEVFTFLSSLYFRGKLAYARAFADPPAGVAGAHVITPDRGLVSIDHPVSLQDLTAFASLDIDPDLPHYRRPLERDARRLARRLGPDCDVVLLGSVATGKYVSVLLDVFGERLLCPAGFVGRGSLSRGGLMLRSAREGRELPYATIATTVRPRAALARRAR
jgi:hypothetical protein